MSTNSKSLNPGHPPSRDGSLRVRPEILIGCALVFSAVIFPGLFSHHYYAQMGLLLVSSVCVISGWFVLVICREFDATFRGWVALFTSVYLTASIPAFFIEFSPITWFMHAHWASLYVRPWVHWGFIYVYLSVLGSFLGRGRARIVFVLASVLLLVLWGSMGPWIY
jgi:hypothetical protein